MIAHSDAPWTPHFARFFVSRGDRFLLISFCPEALDGADDIDMEFVGAEPYDPSREKHLYVMRFWRVRRLLRRFRPEVVFAPYVRSNGLTAVLASPVPVVTSAVGSDVLSPGVRRGWKRLALDRIVKFVCDRSALINPVSAALEQRLLDLGIPPSKILRLPFGVDTHLFRPAENMPRDRAVRLLSTRKHETVYDIPVIIAAVERLKAKGREFHCTFTATGTLLEKHRRKVREAGLEDCTTFTGQLPYAELPRLLAESDIYISASHSDGTSVALLEAIATGVFPVVSRIEANEPWIEHGRTGLMFEPGNVAQLAELLERALDDTELRYNAFGANRHRVEEEVDRDRNMKRLAEAMEKVAGLR